MFFDIENLKFEVKILLVLKIFHNNWSLSQAATHKTHEQTKREVSHDISGKNFYEKSVKKL